MLTQSFPALNVILQGLLVCLSPHVHLKLSHNLNSFFWSEFKVALKYIEPLNILKLPFIMIFTKGRSLKMSNRNIYTFTYLTLISDGHELIFFPPRFSCSRQSSCGR